MKRFLDIVKAVIISPEGLFLAGFSLFVYMKSDYIDNLASQVNTNDETVKYLAVVPISVIVFLFAKRDDLLFPEHNSAYAILQEWPNYHSLLDRYWICIFWGIMGSIPTLAVWLFNGDLSNSTVFSLFFGGIIVSVITLLTFFSATITIKRILSTTTRSKKNKT